MADETMSDASRFRAVPGSPEALERFYGGVGRIVVAAAHIDDQLAQLIGRLVTDDAYVGRIVTAKMGFRTRAHTFASLVAYRTDDRETLELTADLVKRIEKAMDRRDHFVHCLWGAVPIDSKRAAAKFRASRKHGVVLDERQVSIDDLGAVADELESCLEVLRGRLFLLLSHSLHVPVIHMDEKEPDGYRVEIPRPKRRGEPR